LQQGDSKTRVLDELLGAKERHEEMAEAIKSGCDLKAKRATHSRRVVVIPEDAEDGQLHVEVLVCVVGSTEAWRRGGGRRVRAVDRTNKRRKLSRDWTPA
jgi:hypothetical protein